MRCNALLLAGKAQPFLGRSLDRNTGHSAADCLSEVRAHLCDMRREFGRLREYGRVQVAKPVSLFMHECRDMPQQSDAVRACVARVGIREMLADISQGERAEQRIHDRMGSTSASE